MYSVGFNVTNDTRHDFQYYIQLKDYAEFLASHIIIHVFYAWNCSLSLKLHHVVHKHM